MHIYLNGRAKKTTTFDRNQFGVKLKLPRVLLLLLFHLLLLLLLVVINIAVCKKAFNFVARAAARLGGERRQEPERGRERERAGAVAKPSFDSALCYCSVIY